MWFCQYDIRIEIYTMRVHRKHENANRGTVLRLKHETPTAVSFCVQLLCTNVRGVAQIVCRSVFRGFPFKHVSRCARKHGKTREMCARKCISAARLSIFLCRRLLCRFGHFLYTPKNTVFFTDPNRLSADSASLKKVTLKCPLRVSRATELWFSFTRFFLSKIGKTCFCGSTWIWEKRPFFDPKKKSDSKTVRFFKKSFFEAVSCYFFFEFCNPSSVPDRDERRALGRKIFSICDLQQGARKLLVFFRYSDIVRAGVLYLFFFRFEFLWRQHRALWFKIFFWIIFRVFEWCSMRIRCTMCKFFSVVFLKKW